MWKICGKCGKHKALWMFYKDKKRSFSVQSVCIECSSLKCKNYRDNNKDKITLTCQHWVSNNPEYFKHYRDNNKEKVALAKKHWRTNNPEYSKYYYENNKDKIVLHVKHWCELNKGKVNATSAKRRALKLQQSPVLTPIEKALEQKYYELSTKLNTTAGFIKYHVDHIIPIAKGGLQHPDNLQILTQRDNNSKHAKLNYKYKDPQIRITDAGKIKIMINKKLGDF